MDTIMIECISDARQKTKDNWGHPEITLEQAKKYIYHIDFSTIICKLVNHLGWRHKHALAVCNMYKNFLYLNKKYGANCKLPPSEEIDEFWHQHILDTKKYREDCDRIFGCYFDHYPYFGIDQKTTFADLGAAFETMQRLYAKEFNGEGLFQVRNAYAQFYGFIVKVLRRKPNRAQMIS